MKRFIAALAALCFSSAIALAASTVNPNVPASDSDLTSAPIRNNFAATYRDINNLLGQFPSALAPSSPSVGQFWRKTNVTPQIVYQWTGTAWVQVGTFDVTAGRITYVGSGLLAWSSLATGGLGAADLCLKSTGTGTLPSFGVCAAGAGTVSSVALSMPSVFSVAGSPITTSGTFAVTLATQTANTVFAGPTTGSAAAPTFRSLVANDIPTLTCSKLSDASTFCSTTNASGLTGTLNAEQMPALTGDVISSAGSVSTTIANNAVTLAKFQQIATASFLGRTTAATGNVEVLTATQATALLNVFVADSGSGGAKGLVPATVAGDATKFLRGDATWVTVPIGLTVGSTAISGGVDGSVLRNNAGVLAEYAISGTGSVCMTTSCAMTTPSLGVATATSINGLPITTTPTLTSVAIGGTAGAGFLELGNQSSAPATPTAAGRLYFDASNRFAWKGESGFVASVDATGLSAARAFVLPNLAGTFALTANNLSVFAATTSAQLAGVVSDETGSGALVFGTTPALASPALSGTVTGDNTIPLTILAQSAANTMLGNWTGSTANVTANAMPSCPDTGTNHLNYVSGTGITCGTAGGGGLTVGTTTIASGNDTRVLFNNAGVLGQYVITGTGSVAMSASPTFTGTVNVAAITASGLIKSSSSGISDPSGTGIIYMGPSSFDFRPDGSASLVLRTSGLEIKAAGYYSFSSTSDPNSSADMYLTRPAAATLQLGAANVDLNANVVAQKLTTQGPLAGGTSNQAGKDFTLLVSPGKGTGIGGSFIVQTTPAGGSGTSINAGVTALTIDSTALVTFSAGVTIAGAAVTLSGLGAAGVGATYVCIDTNVLKTGATCAASSKGIKDNVVNFTAGIDMVRSLRTVAFDFKPGYRRNGTASIGMMAEDVAVVSTKLAAYQDGVLWSWQEKPMIAVLTSAVQNVDGRVVQLERHIEKLQADNDNLRSTLLRRAAN